MQLALMSDAGPVPYVTYVWTSNTGCNRPSASACMVSALCPALMFPSPMLSPWNAVAVASVAAAVLCRHLDSTYGPHWMALNSTHQQTSQQDAAPDWRVIQEALLARLAVTAWGDLPWEQREQQCEARPAEGGAAVPAATDEDAEAAAAAAEGAWGSQSAGSAAASKHASGAGAPAGSDMLAKGAATADAPAGEDVLGAGLPDAAAAAVSTFAAAAESAREEDAGPAAGQPQHVGDGDTAAVSALVAADAGRVGGVRKEDSEPQQVPGRSKQEVLQGAGAALPAAAAETMAAAADQPAEGDAG